MRLARENLLSELMSSAFDQLLDISIRYLAELQREGHRTVELKPENLALLEELRAHPARWALKATAKHSPSAPPIERMAPSMAPDLFQADAATPEGERLVGPAKAAAFDALRERALACAKCTPLVRTRRNVVFGVGNINAELMFVGEAPGMDEDRAGEPFVGRAGQLLTRIIETMGLKREEVYIANILKCRPDTPGQSAGNRKPTPEEMRTCIPYLHAQIDLIGPKVLVALGATAIEGLLGKIGGITRVRGQWQTYRGIRLMPTYHPAYLLRNQSLQEKRRIWEDMMRVMEELHIPISERQRGFFLQ